MAGTLVANTINTDTGLFSTNNAYSGIAKAWCAYNGTTQTVSASFNISSVTYNSTGNYTYNFTTAMSDANFSVVATNDQGNSITCAVYTANTTTTTNIANQRSGSFFNGNTFIAVFR
jgi:exopolysaccharide biosynthesis protein